MTKPDVMSGAVQGSRRPTTSVRKLCAFCGMGGRLVGSWDCSEPDTNPIPAVDGDDGHGEADQLLFSEELSDLLIDIVGCMRVSDQGQSFGPGERGPLAIGVERRFPPGVEQIETLLGFASRAGILGMHIETERAAVDL